MPCTLLPLLSELVAEWGDNRHKTNCNSVFMENVLGTRGGLSRPGNASRRGVRRWSPVGSSAPSHQPSTSLDHDTQGHMAYGALHPAKRMRNPGMEGAPLCRNPMLRHTGTWIGDSNNLK